VTGALEVIGLSGKTRKGVIDKIDKIELNIRVPHLHREGGVIEKKAII
jgi:hypothetical protein